MEWLRNEFKPGTIVTYKREYGVIVEIDGQLLIRWDTKDEWDFEQLSGGNWLPKVIEHRDFKWINNDGSLKVK